MVNAQQSATRRNWNGNWVAQQNAELTTAQRVWNWQTESQTLNDAIGHCGSVETKPEPEMHRPPSTFSGAAQSWHMHG